MLIANSLLVPRWATWDEFRRLEALGLTMFGQMTAGSWIYIGTQGILQGTYQTFAAAGEKHFGSAELSGRTILTAGLGGMGGAQPLAATLAGAAILCIEVDPARIQRRLDTGYLDAELFATIPAAYGVDLIGPTRPDVKRQNLSPQLETAAAYSTDAVSIASREACSFSASWATSPHAFRALRNASSL